MTSKKRFINKIVITSLAKKHVVLALSIGIAFFFIFYFFLQYAFLLIRNVQLGFEYNVDFSFLPRTRNIIAFIFASTASLVGNATGIAFLFSGTSKNGLHKKFRKAILNDQAFLTPSAIYWFLKIVIFIFSSLIVSFYPQFLEEYHYVIPLLALTLFLDQVKSLRRYVDGYSICKMLLHLCTLVLFTTVLAITTSRTYDVQATLQQERSFYIQIPDITVEKNVNSKIVDASNSYYGARFKVREENDTLLIHYGDQYVRLRDVQVAILESRESHSRVDAVFYIEKSVKWTHLQPLMEEVLLTNGHNILFALRDSLESKDTYYQHYIALTKKIYHKWETSENMPPPPPPPSFFEDVNQDKNIDTLSLSSFKLQNKTNQIEVKNFFTDRALENTAYVFDIDDTITLENYINFMIGYKTAIFDLRELYRNHRSVFKWKNELEAFPLNYEEVYP